MTSTPEEPIEQVSVPPSTSTEELIARAVDGLRAEFTTQIEVLKNELGVRVIEEISRAEMVDPAAATKDELVQATADMRNEIAAATEPTENPDVVTVGQLAQALTDVRQDVECIAVEAVAALPDDSKPVDAATRKRVTQIHAYVDGLADRLALPRMEAN